MTPKAIGKLVLIAAIGAFISYRIGLYLLEIVALSSWTAQYKEVRPYSTAIEMGIGKNVTTNVIRAERLEICEYTPPQLCVRLVVDNKGVDNPELLREIRMITENVCVFFKTRTENDLERLAIGRKIQPSMLRQSLLRAANCLDGKSPLQAYSFSEPMERTDSYTIITLKTPANIKEAK